MTTALVSKQFVAGFGKEFNAVAERAGRGDVHDAAGGSGVRLSNTIASASIARF
jgi:hypothetical protein